MFKFRYCLLFSLLFFPAALLAEENTDSQSEETQDVKPSYKMPSTKLALKNYNQAQKNQSLLSPVTVTASSTVADELLSPKSVSIYSKDQIVRSGASNLFDFFKYYTEIQTDTNFGNTLNPQLSLRGFGNGDGYQNIKVIVDGLSLNQIDMVPQQLGSIPINSVEKIEVAKNGGTVLYGDNSAAGAIIIRTNNSFDRPRFYGTLRSGFGTYNSKVEYINLGSVNDFGGVKVLADGNFTYFDSEGKKSVLTDGTRDTAENLTGKLNLGLQTDRLEILQSFSKDDANFVYTGTQTPEAFERDPSATVTNGSRNIVHKEDWVTSLKYRFNDRFNAAYTYANKSRDSIFPHPLFPFAAHYEGDDHRFTVQTLQDRFTVLAGFEHNNNLRKSDDDITAKENIAGFISGDLFLTDRLTLNAGFRQSFVTFKHDNGLKNEHLTRTVRPVSVDGALNYSLSKSDAVFASYAHAFQSPDIDRFFTTVFSSDFTRQTTAFNRFINTMEMDTYAFGYKHMDDRLRVKAEFYYSDLNNEIYFNSIPVGSDFFGRNTNYDASSKYGVELSAYKDFDLFFASVNYVFTDTRTHVGSQVFQIGGQPKHLVLATLGKEFSTPAWPLPYHIVSLSHKYQSDSYAQDDFDNSLGKQQSYNATTFNYQLTDRKHWTVDFSIQNLFNGANGQFVDFGAGQAAVYPTNYQRTFQGSVSYRF